MPKVTIYTTAFCPYCHSAKALLRRKNIEFSEIDVSYDAEQRQRMITKAQGQRTVPQIFIGETHVGGSDELHALDRQGKLDPLLAGTAPA
jgi:glutaredoxin 3